MLKFFKNSNVQTLRS